MSETPLTPEMEALIDAIIYGNRGENLTDDDLLAILDEFFIEDADDDL